MKARAERFGIPFNPNPSPRPAQKSATPTTPTTTTTTTAATSGQAAETKTKSGIDKTALGLSDEVLAQRAAKFGIPGNTAASPASAASAAPAPRAKGAEPEITP